MASSVASPPATKPATARRAATVGSPATSGCPDASRMRARLASWAISLRVAHVGDRLAEVVVGAAEAGEVVLWQVDATRGEVLADVLQVFDDLQPAADVVGEAGEVGIGDPEDGEHDATDRVGRQPAVVEQLVERGVAVLALVAAVGLDEIPERGEVEPVAPDRRRQGIDGGMDRLSTRRSVEIALRASRGRRDDRRCSGRRCRRRGGRSRTRRAGRFAAGGAAPGGRPGSSPTSPGGARCPGLAGPAVAPDVGPAGLGSGWRRAVARWRVVEQRVDQRFYSLYSLARGAVKRRRRIRAPSASALGRC